MSRVKLSDVRYRMKERFHGIDLHKNYATIMVRDSDGKEIQFISRCKDFHEYVEALGEKDSVVIESINNAFYWADRIEKQGASCVIVNAYKFKIIKESWHKTDKRDAANLSIALWMSEMRHEFKMPSVYKPSVEVRELRKLFSQYQMISEQIVQYKNSIQAIFVENGIALNKNQARRLFKNDGDVSILDESSLTDASRQCIMISLSLVWGLDEQKERTKNEILGMGTFFEKEIRLCISIKGVSPFLVLAFLADVGDITRFKNARGFNSYLGVVPSVKSSGGKTQMGHITRQSRKLARTLFTQPINHIINSSDSMTAFYEGVKNRRGVGRSRIAVIRKIFNIMRSMILHGEVYWGKDENNYQKKLSEFEKIIHKSVILTG
jgi:transposase